MKSARGGSSGSLLAVAAHALGRGAGKVRLAAGGSPSRVGPLAGAAAVSALWTAAYGWVNVKKWKRGSMTKEEALRETANESVGIGLATGAGIAAANLVRVSSLVASSASLAPFLIAAAVTGGAKALWDRRVKRGRSLGGRGGERELETIPVPGLCAPQDVPAHHPSPG
ncbi:MAG TPA: hypothetical protein VM492_16705 [Sumerlaeia bacterium]|nr:hypothetical protein [Sumerlaeia bacterium]